MGAQIRTAVWEEKRLSFVQQEGKRRDGIPCGENWLFAIANNGLRKIVIQKIDFAKLPV